MQHPIDRRQQFSTAIIFGLPLGALTTSFGMTLIQFLILLSVAWWARDGIAVWYRRNGSKLSWIIVAFTGYFVVSLLRALINHQGTETVDGPSRMLFALSCIGFVAWCRPSRDCFWLGLCFGTIGAALIACLQRFFLHMERVEGYAHHPITFGNLALVMGLISLCALYDWRTKSRLVYLPYLAFFCGVLSSILSGSRGGWLALVLLMPLMFLVLRAGRAGAVVLVISALMVLVYHFPGSGVAARLQDAVSDVRLYVDVHELNTNVGIRLELWKASWLMFTEHPWVGVGRDQFHAALLQLAAQGEVKQSQALIHYSSHNDALNFLATGGLLDFSFLVLLYGAPFMFFLRVWRAGDPAVRGPAMGGLILVLSFIGFGLTDVMFWLMMTNVFYVMMTGVLVGFCMQQNSLQIVQ